jgi:hypothetical protein
MDLVYSQRKILCRLDLPEEAKAVHLLLCALSLNSGSAPATKGQNTRLSPQFLPLRTLAHLFVLRSEADMFL